MTKRRPESPYAAAFRQLDEQGYCVIPGVVPADRCAAHRDGVLAYIRNCGVDLLAPTTRQADVPHLHGIIQTLELGHAKAIWDVRQEPGVIDAFTELYGDNDLLVSFDGACYMTPGFVRSKSWLHVDQSHARLGRRCIQGYVNLAPSHDARSGSLSVLPGSHLRHAAFAAAHPDAVKDNNDWFKFADDWHGGAPVRVFGDVGSLVLWDSRTVHQNVPPAETPTRERCVVYVCYQPRALATPATLAKRIDAYVNYRMTTHWPATRVILFPKKARWSDGAKTHEPVRDRIETPLMRQLVGLDPCPLRLVTTPALEFVQ